MFTAIDVFNLILLKQDVKREVQDTSSMKSETPLVSTVNVKRNAGACRQKVQKYKSIKNVSVVTSSHSNIRKWIRRKVKINIASVRKANIVQRDRK